MKKGKKLLLLSAVIALLVVCFTFGASALAESGSLGGNITYTYDSATGEVVISGKGGMKDYLSSTSPLNSIDIKKVKIENGVTRIGDNLFRFCENLVSVEIPDSVTSIGGYAFYNCTKLESIATGNGVTLIGSYAFDNCTNLSKVTIGNSVKYINECAFYRCERVTEFILPDSVESIGYSAFGHCKGITSIKIPKNVTNLNVYAFYFCTNLKQFTVDENNEYYSHDEYGVLYNKDKTLLIQYPINSDETIYAVPEGVEYIQDYAFYNITNLKKVIIPEGVTSILEATFRYSYNLTEVILPNSITSIGEYAFGSCTSLKNIIIPEKVTSIGKGAFNYCTSLESIIIPNSVIDIGSWAFSYCESLESVEISKNLTYISLSMFQNCTSLKSIIIPEKITTISSQAFYACKNLENITIPKSMNIGGYLSFSGTNIKNVYITDIESWCNIEFGYPTATPLYNGGNLYIDGEPITEITIPYGITKIGDYQFYNCLNLENIIIPDSVTTIGYTAFGGCSNLKNIIIPNSVTTIYGSAFQKCTNLKTITIPSSIKRIIDWTFYECDNLTDVYFEGTEEQWKEMFIGKYNTSLTNANIHFIHTCQSDDEWTVISEPTAVSEGKKVKYCTICGGEISEKIPRLTIDWKSDENYGLVNFTVVDATTLKPIRNASLNISTETDESTVYKTDADGKVSAVLPVGKITISASAEGKNTRNLKLNVTHREYDAPLIGLSDKPLVEASIDVKTMTYDEIVNAGISVKDPSNYNVLKYTITFYYEGIPTEVTFYDNDGDKTYVEPDVEGGGYIIGKDDGQDVVVYPNERFYLIIKGEVFWLKQMLEIEMNVYNNSLTDTFEDVEATLIIPEGLSLAAMNEGEQTLVQKLDDVAEGGTTKCIWYVRCDEGGTYNIGVNLKGMLMPWEEDFEESFMTKNPIKVYDENALKLYVKAPTTVECGKSYDIVIGIENISDITLYNVTHTVKNIEQGVVRHYSGGIVVKEVYADEKLDTSVFDAEFKPGDKLEITVNTNILFESEIYEDCIYRLVDAIIDAEDVKTQLDSNFGIYTEHLFGAPTKLPATCTENGEITAVCERCGKKDTEIIPAHGHNYIDGECEHCGDNLTDDCTCNCHKGGIGGFIYKILRIFWKLFKTNQYCACGVAHY